MSNITFSENVRHYGEPYWSAATDHVFIDQMVKDELSLDAFRHYLVQDYAFFRHFTDLIAHTIVNATEMMQIHRLAGFLSDITDAENDYFLRSFNELGVTEEQYSNPPLNPVMQRFAKTIEQAIGRGYNDCLMVLLCAEWVYWTWADNHRDQHPQAFYFSEWLTLHNNQQFTDFVAWLRSEVDRFSTLSDDEQQRLKQLFRTCCQLEEDFFSYAYQQGQ